MATIELLTDISFLIVAATIFAYIARFLKQPMIPAYIIAGAVIGPLGFNLIKGTATMASFGELGIAFLLFIVGLELSVRRLKDIGMASSIIGTAQVLIIAGIGYFVSIFLGFKSIEALYIGLAIAFSSTLIVIKLLADKKELDTLHGRLMLGILLMQDVLVIFVLSFLTNIGNFGAEQVSITLLKGFGLLAIGILASKYILGYIFECLARSRELLFLTSLTWLFIFSALAFYSGFSIAIGAFIGGVGMAAFPYNYEIIGLMRSLKDFFVIIFFVVLGMQIAFAPLAKIFVPLMALILLALLIKPIVIGVLTRIFNYGKRTTFLTSGGLGQVSEFSLVLAAFGKASGHISNEVFSIILLGTIVTIAATTYFIEYDMQIYQFLSKRFMTLRKETYETSKLERVKKKLKKHVVVCGAKRMGASIVKELLKINKDFIVVDFDPDVIKRFMGYGANVMYGDIGDEEILERLNLEKADMVVSTAPIMDANMVLIKFARCKSKNIKIFVTATNINEALGLYRRGADYVMLPRILGGEKIAHIIDSIEKKKKYNIKRIKEEQIRKLKHLQEEEILGAYEQNMLKALRDGIKAK